jgi:hypothetical protein
MRAETAAARVSKRPICESPNPKIKQGRAGW